MSESERNELIRCYGWEEISHPKMVSFIKDGMRMNIYSTGTFTIQRGGRNKMFVEKILTLEELENLLTKYEETEN